MSRSGCVELARRLSLLAALTQTGCGQLEPGDQLSLAIEGGTPAPDDQAVVAVVNIAGGQCTGSLIAPRLVLTARHCIAETAEQETQVVCGQTPFDPPDSAGAIFVVALPEITQDPADYLAVAEVRMPEHVADDLCGTDVALLVLEEAIADITPLEPRVEQAAAVGESYSAVGFGSDEADEGLPSGVRKRLDELEVTCAGAACEGDDVRDNEWVGSGGPCHGDSGGPALDGEGRVMGVVSRGKSSCREPVFGDVATRSAWLKAEAIAAANASQAPPPSWAPCDAEHPCVTQEASKKKDALDSSCRLATGFTPASRGWPFVLMGLLALARRLRSAR